MLDRNPLIYFEHTPYPLEKGCVLISVPLCGGGEYFERKVVLVLFHDEGGAYGLVLNKSTGVTYHQLFKIKRVNLPNVPLLGGGPVNIDHMYSLHNFGNLTKDTFFITDEFYFDPLSDEVIDKIDNDESRESIVRVFFGCTGWSAGQLESEIERKMWVIGQFQKELLFCDKDDDCWKMAVKSLGEKYMSWFDIVRKPELN